MIFIIKNALNSKSYQKIFPIGVPGPAITPREQGELIFKIAKKPKKFLSIPSIFLKILYYAITPISIFSTKSEEFQEFVKIALFYSSEFMLIWNPETNMYSDSETCEIGKDTLEDYYQKIFESETKVYDLSDRKLFFPKLKYLIPKKNLPENFCKKILALILFILENYSIKEFGY